MILVFLIPSAILLFGVIVLLTLRAQIYVREHPELVGTGAPASYNRCQMTLLQVIERYHQLKPDAVPRAAIAWQASNGRFYRINEAGVEEQQGPGTMGRYHLAWEAIGGVGLRMQPGFNLVDATGNNQADIIVTSDYAFYLLIVPVTGRTLSLRIPTHGSPDAVDFVAYTLLIAERMNKRINVFGFDRPPAPARQRARRF